MRKAILLAAAAGLLALSGLSAQAAALNASEKAALQAAMFRHIDGQPVNGGFLRLNVKAGQAEALAPSRAHPMILRMGDHFILCSDFRDRAGKDVNIDFYMARNGSGYTVFHTEVDNRMPLEQLMSSGKVVPAE